MKEEWRRLMFQKEGQDECYRCGAYAYQEEIGLYPKYEVIAGYIRWFECHRIVDIGCGQAMLSSALYHDEDYIGLDQSRGAVEMAKGYHNNIHHVDVKIDDYVNHLEGWADCVVWAGVGMPWTKKGYGGNHNDMRVVFPVINMMLRSEGYVILESAGHIQHLEGMLKEECPHYSYVAGCDIELLDSEMGPRSVRVYRK